MAGTRVTLGHLSRNRRHPSHIYPSWPPGPTEPSRAVREYHPESPGLSLSTWDSTRRGFTIIEILIVLAIICILAAIAIPGYVTYRHKAKVAMMMAELRMLEKEITNYTIDNGDFPSDLSDIGCDQWRDAWDQPYKYLKIAGENPKGGVKGKRRRDRNMNPVNSDYDLYSMGSDGRTQAQFTAKFGRDDIVRARDGDYFGLAENYH